MDVPCFTHVSDDELTRELARLAAAEREATVSLLVALAEFDRRQLYLPAGFSSLFIYSTQHLRLGEGAAYRRIEASRLCARFPAALALLAKGEVTITALTLLGRHLTIANHAALLARVSHKSKRQVEILVAELNPRPDVATSVRKLPGPQSRSASMNAPTAANATPALQEALPSHRPVVAPLAPERFKLQITMSRETHDTLREVQDLIRHSVPNGDAAIIVARALTLLRDHLRRRKWAQTSRPRKKRSRGSRSRHIPAEVRRLVRERDGERCAFIGRDGRCEERSMLEFHHVRPFAAGGPADARNIELRCRVHNGHEAEVFFGRRYEKQPETREALTAR